MARKGKKGGHVNPKYQKNKNASAKKLERNLDHFKQGHHEVLAHPIFRQMYYDTRYITESQHCPPTAWAVITDRGVLYPNIGRVATAAEWQYIVAHNLLHLGMGHFQEKLDPLAWNLACDCIIAKFLQSFKFGEPPFPLPGHIELPAKTEDDLYAYFMEEGIPADLYIYGMTDVYTQDMEKDTSGMYVDKYYQQPDWETLFASGLSHAMSRAIDVAAGKADSIYDWWDHSNVSLPQKARQWFVNHYPLLGALAVSFEIVEDEKLCQALDISIAAVDIEGSKLYFNPAAYAVNWRQSDNWDTKLDESELRFVMAHELLHVALRHHARQQGRDAYLWNVACDYVINGWLYEMDIAKMPHGLLYDPELKGMNAEAVYDLIMTEKKKYEKLATLRGKGKCDMLDGSTPYWWEIGKGLTLDEFYRRVLANGLEYHCSQGRGFLPAGLEEEIRSLSQPPIPWDVELAQWFDARFPPIEKRRSYARLSRRQSATPDIPRPSYIKTEIDDKSRTFGVVLDTSGSMDVALLGKALGAIASYAMARDVPAARVVYCDAHPYDAGYMLPEQIIDRVKIRGRGGTVLQPAVDLLRRAKDFPEDGPILIITDGWIESNLRVKGDHAYLLPKGYGLPFPAKGPVFYIS